MSGASILIVEDEAIIAADLANKLGQFGYEVCGVTARGEEALTLTRDRRPDLVLMDIQLAGAMDGVDAAEHIRLECDVPVIYLTAHSDRATLQRAKLAEPFGYILKPFDERELETHIEMALYRHQAERKLRESEATLRGVLNATQESVWLFSPDGIMLMGNATAWARFGKPSEEVVGKHFTEVLPPELAQSRLARLREAVESKQLVECEDQRAGILFSHDFYPVLDAAGNVAAVACFSRDITQRKRADEERERLLAEVVQRAAETEGVFAAQQDVVLVYDTEMNVRRANPSFSETYGFDPVGMNVKDIMARVGCRRLDGVPLVLDEQPTPRALRGELVKGVTYGVTLADGTETAVETSSGPMRTGDVITGSVTVWHDISERIRHENDLQRLNRTLRARSHSDVVLMHAVNESEYLDEVCKIVVEDCGYAMVWIGFAEEDEGKKVRPVASAGFEKSYLDTLRVTWADAPNGRGPTGTAIRMGKPCGCRNMVTDPQFTPWREEALRRGYASSLALPLMDGDRAFGAITIYAKVPEAFSEEETDLLLQLAGDLAFGVTALRLRAAHAQATASLTFTEERYRSLFNGMTEGFALHEIITDEDGAPCDYRFIEVNPAFERLTGLKASDIVGRTHNEALPDNSRRWVEVYGKVALTGEPTHFEDYAAPLGRWYEVFSYRPAPRQFAVIFMDVTVRKQAEADIRKHVEELNAANEDLSRFNRVAVGRELRMIELKKQVNQLCAEAGKPMPYPLDFDKNHE